MNELIIPRKFPFCLLVTLIEAGIYTSPTKGRIPRAALSNSPLNKTHGPFQHLIKATTGILLQVGLPFSKISAAEIPSQRGRYIKFTTIPASHPIQSFPLSHLKLFLKHQRLQAPIPLTKGQQTDERIFGTHWRELFIKVKKAHQRPKFKTFAHRLLNHTLPIWGTCPHCQERNSTNHLFRECPILAEHTATALKTLLSPPHTQHTLSQPPFPSYGDCGRLIHIPFSIKHHNHSLSFSKTSP